MAAQYTAAELNAYRDFANGRIATIKLFDEAGVERYSQAIQSKTLGDRRILIVQALLAADLNNRNIAKAQIVNSNGSIAAEQLFEPPLDKRPGSPIFNLPVNVVLTMHY